MEQRPPNDEYKPDTDAKTISRALRLLANQRKATRAYYERNKEAIKARTIQYWKDHREELNERRRLRYEQRKQGAHVLEVPDEKE